MMQPFFKDEVIASKEPFIKECITRIAAMSVNSPQQLKLSGWLSEMDGDIWGLRISLKSTMNMAHSGWIYWQLSTMLRNSNTRVGCMIGDMFEQMGQFTLVNLSNVDAYFVAIGPKAKDVLETIISAEESYNPENFDEDGYSKASLKRSNS